MAAEPVSRPRYHPLARKSLSASIAESAAETTGLQRRFGLVSLTLLGVGAMIGLGIFVVTGQVAAQAAGPGIVISFLIASAIVACAALCYAELASMVPVAGASAYTYAYVTLGQFAAWLVAWIVLLQYLCGASALAIGWSGYFVGLAADFGISFDQSLVGSPFTFSGDHFVTSGALVNLPALLVVLASGLIVAFGAASVARLGSFFVAVKLGVITVFVLVGMCYVDPGNWQPLVPPAEVVDGATRYGWAGVFTGVGLIFYSYLGFDTISTASQETRDPQRTVPRAILLALAISTLFYALVALTMTGLVSFRQLNVAAPLYVALSEGAPSQGWLRMVTSLGGSIGLCSGVLAALFGLSRIIYAMARDGLLHRSFTRVGRRTGTPWLGVAVPGLIVTLLAAFVPISLLGEMGSASTLLGFAVVGGSVAWLRIREPDAQRGFRVPVWPLTVTIALSACLYFLADMRSEAILYMIAWLALSAAAYFITISKLKTEENRSRKN